MKKIRLTCIEIGYQYIDDEKNTYTLYEDECEEDDTGLVYDYEFIDDGSNDIYIFD